MAASWQRAAALAQTIALENFQLDPTSNIHGVPHWDRVAKNARLLVSRLETGASLDICMWFAYLHDCMRDTDHDDPQHGQRAASLATDVWTAGRLPLNVEDFELLRIALADHSAGYTTGHLLMRICWDADRLDLPRVGTMPEPAKMCTTVGRKLAQIMTPTKVDRGAYVAPQFRRPR